MGWSSVIGQKVAKHRLGTLFSGEPGHAYVLTGPTGIGKTMLAMETARALLCSEVTPDGACDQCANCRYTAAGTHPDLRILTIPDGEKGIRVADVRSKVSSDISIYPQIATRKVYVIDGDGLNEEGQNAILKTLEEPPSYAVFLITVQDASKLLPTVMSRSVTVALSPNTEEEVLSILTSRLGVPAKDAVFYARYANGIPGHAINLAQSQWFSGLREDVAGLIFSIPDAGKASILTSAYSFFETEKDHCDEILLIIGLIFRDMAFLTSDGGAVNLLNDDKRDKMKSVISRHKLSVSNIRRANDAVTRASRSLLANCSYESTVCQMLLSIQKELSNA